MKHNDWYVIDLEEELTAFTHHLRREAHDTPIEHITVNDIRDRDRVAMAHAVVLKNKNYTRFLKERNFGLHRWPFFQNESLFDASVIITVLSGRMLSRNHMEGIYKCLNWATGESVYTHQIPRVMDELSPLLKVRYPALAHYPHQEVVDNDTAKVWLEKLAIDYPTPLPVPRMNANQHESIDPMSELAEKIHPDKIIQVKP